VEITLTDGNTITIDQLAIRVKEVNKTFNFVKAEIKDNIFLVGKEIKIGLSTTFDNLSAPLKCP
jgi:hypothetical protein